jgi:bifunctional N6-L-threonylcarbamoyladenine synthase / protein kinase Bud32
MTRKLMNEGAESRLYSDKVLGYEVVIKERQPKPYRISELDTDIRKSRTKCEARIIERLRKAGVRVPALIAVSTYEIYMEKIEGKLLKDITKKDARLFTEIGKTLAAVHKADVAHGDFTPANIIVSGKKIVLIDFGLSESTNSVEEKALDLLLMKRSVTSMQYASIIKSYTGLYGSSRTIIERLTKIEQRGRYQTRTLA